MTRRRVLLLGLLATAVGVAAAAWLLWPRTAITRENAAKVREGMTLAEVEAILGGPARDETTGPVEREEPPEFAPPDAARSPLANHYRRPAPRCAPMGVRSGQGLGAIRRGGPCNRLPGISHATRRRRGPRHAPPLAAAVGCGPTLATSACALVEVTSGGRSASDDAATVDAA